MCMSRIDYDAILKKVLLQKQILLIQTDAVSCPIRHLLAFYND